MPCYKYNLMRQSIGTMNLANLKIMFFVEEIVFTANAKNSMQIIFTTFN